MENNYTNPVRLNSKIVQSMGILLRLLGFIVVGSVSAAFLFSVVSGISIDNIQNLISNPDSDTKVLLWSLQGISQLLTFIILPLIYVYFFNKSLYPKFLLRSDNLGIYSLIAVLIIFSSIPLISWLSDLNKSIHFPESLSGIERWAESKENAAKKLTEMIAYYSNTNEFIIAIIVMAVIPAIGEEILFRGIIQNEFSSILKNPHAAIWITGFIFSFMHFQFYGFFPRMLLGVSFGYLYYWSGNILIPILLHFLNNALTLIAMNLYQQKVIEIDPETTESMSWVSIVISIIVFSFLLFIFKRFNTLKTEENN